MIVTTPSLLLGIFMSVSPVSPALESRATETYSKEQIYALRIFGVGLGMNFDTACRTLMLNGLKRGGFAKNLDACDDKHINEEGFDTYFGDTQIAESEYGHVSSLTLHFTGGNGQRIIQGISVYTDEPKKRRELEDHVRKVWGRPTFYASWGYEVLNYAATGAEADYYNRSDYNSCTVWNGCYDEPGPKCHKILHRFAAPYATQVIFDWGRHIEIEDGNLFLEESRNNGFLDELLRKDIKYACPIPRIH